MYQALSPPLKGPGYKASHMYVHNLTNQPHVYVCMLADKLAVIVQMEYYVILSEEYQLDQIPFGPKIVDIRYTILNFTEL